MKKKEKQNGKIHFLFGVFRVYISLGCRGMVYRVYHLFFVCGANDNNNGIGKIQISETLR